MTQHMQDMIIDVLGETLATQSSQVRVSKVKLGQSHSEMNSTVALARSLVSGVIVQCQGYSKQYDRPQLCFCSTPTYEIKIWVRNYADLSRIVVNSACACKMGFPHMQRQRAVKLHSACASDNTFLCGF